MADPALLETLSTLSTQIDNLSTSLSPLLKGTPYSELIDQQSSSPLLKAKLDITVSYALHDLIWVYLKTSGVDPTNHPVMQEIERLKSYFGKLKTAESGPSSSTSTTTGDQRRMQIDKNVAARFINHAISSKKARIDPDYTSTGEDQDAEMGGVGGSGTHTRFDQDEQDVSNEEEELEGIEKNEEVERLLDDDKEEEEDLPAVEEEEISSSKKKGKRKILDPFAGYDQPKPSATEKRKLDSTTTTYSSTPALKNPDAQSTTTTTNETGPSSNKKSKKKDKQKKLKMKK
ncbi:hypothetical protein JCM5350_005692 [Sporobolomyces pararoseus]